MKSIIIYLTSITLTMAINLNKPELTYSDGSGNLYSVYMQGNSFYITYDPVKPMFSSSGIYDGGEAQKKKITSQEMASLKKLVKQLVKSGKDRAENRNKGTGSITLHEKGKPLKAIFLRGSKSKEQVENRLKRLLKD